MNQRKARWSLYLSRFDFTLKYIAGKSMGRADSLSRRVDWAEGVEKDNENQIMLKRKMARSKSNRAVNRRTGGRNSKKN